MANKGFKDRIQNASGLLADAAKNYPNGFQIVEILPAMKALDKRFDEAAIKRCLGLLYHKNVMLRIERGRYKLKEFDDNPRGEEALDADEQILNQALSSILALTKLIQRLKDRNRKMAAMLEQFTGPVSKPAKGN